MYDDYSSDLIFDDSLSNTLEDDLSSYYKQIAKYPILTHEKERELILAYKKNNDTAAKDVIIMSTSRLVINIAKQYQHHHPSIMDTIQDGNMGLIDALEKFDINKNVRFSTYATYWIKHYILKGIFASSNIKITQQQYVSIKEILKLKNQIEIETGKDVSIQELATILDIPFDDVKELLQLQSIIMLSDDTDNFINLSDDSFNPESVLNTTALHDVLLEILDEFQEQERNIIIQKYGLEDGISKTEQELSEMYHSSVAKIRQIESKALRKMKSPKIKKRLKAYL